MPNFRNDPNRLLIPRNDAARMLSLSTKTIDRAIVAGTLRPTRIGRRVLIHREELAAFARS